MMVVGLFAMFLGAPTLPASAASTAPILLIVSSAAPNPFGAYLGEILRAEGLNAFDRRTSAA
jgi:hypothetical protein